MNLNGWIKALTEITMGEQWKATRTVSFLTSDIEDLCKLLKTMETTHKIYHKYDIWQWVGIKNLDNQPAQVIEISMTGHNLWYKLDYWWNGELKSVTQTEEDLVELKEHNSVGLCK